MRASLYYPSTRNYSAVTTKRASDPLALRSSTFRAEFHPLVALQLYPYLTHKADNYLFGLIPPQLRFDTSHRTIGGWRGTDQTVLRALIRA